MIESERLSLREITQSDLNDIHLLHSFEEVDEYNTLGIPKDKNETESIINEWMADHIKTKVLAIFLKQNQQFIGLLGLSFANQKSRRVELWYKLIPTYWGNAYATEALKKVRDHCFEKLNLHRIQAGCAVENQASIKVLEKIGMKKEGRGREILALKNGWSDNYTYAMLKTDPRP